MNAPRLRTNSGRPHGPLATLFGLAPLIVMGCMSRTALRSPAGGSEEPDESADTGGQTGEVVAGAGSGGGIVAGAAGYGGIGGAGGNAPASSVLGGASGGSRSSAPGGTATNPSGGRSAAGGTGGATTARSSSSRGGTTGTGNAPATGGRSGTGGSVATGGNSAPGAPTILPDGFVTVKTGTVVMAGHVSSYMSGSGSSIGLKYDSTSFCASGTVAADPTYNSWAGAGFNVNQAESGASGSSGSLVLTGSTASITYVNRAASTLEFQMWDGTNFWCAYLPASPNPSTVAIPFSKLNTQCWSGAGSSFTSGTPISAVQLVVGGNASIPTPFDFCFLGLTIQ